MGMSARGDRARRGTVLRSCALLECESLVSWGVGVLGRCGSSHSQLDTMYNHLEVSLSEGLSGSGWPMGIVLIIITAVGGPSALGAAPFPELGS